MKQSLYSCATPSILRYNGKSRDGVSTNQQREWFRIGVSVWLWKYMPMGVFGKINCVL